MTDETPRIAPLRIVFYPDPILREVCSPYKDADFDDKLAAFAKDLLGTMYAERGVGLAAPQVNHNRRIIAIDPTLEREDGFVLVNPVITETNGSVSELERCLSLPHEAIEARVTRPEWVRCEYHTADGKKETIEGDGLLARVLQHEIDHLDGILFTDRLSSIKKLSLRKHLRKLESKYGPK